MSEEETTSRYGHIEQEMFDEHGDPDTLAEIWTIQQEVLDDTTAAFTADLVAMGPDAYEGLSMIDLAVSISKLPGLWAVAIRTGMWIAPKSETGVRPSRDPDKRSGVVTCFLSDDEVVTISRITDTGEIQTSLIRADDYVLGEQRLVDALVRFRQPSRD